MDDCVDRGLAKEITGRDVLSVPEAGWASIKNGELLGRAQVEFDVFITTDRNLMFQQNLPKYDLAVIVLAAKTNRLKDLLPLVAVGNLPILLDLHTSIWQHTNLE